MMHLNEPYIDAYSNIKKGQFGEKTGAHVVGLMKNLINYKRVFSLLSIYLLFCLPILPRANNLQFNDSRSPVPSVSQVKSEEKPAAPEISQEEKDKQTLSQILQKTADYCKHLEEMSIYYYCREKVKETIYPLPVRYRGIMNRSIGIHGQIYKFQNKDSIVNEYLYDYQLIRKGKKKVKEKRTLLEENGKKKNRKNATLQTKCFRYDEIVYGPLVFEESEQRLYRFALSGKEKWGEQDVLVIRVFPREGVQKKLFYGAFYVREKDYSILKIKMSQRAMGNFHKIEKAAVLMNADPRVTIIMEYDNEKNGIRFPSKFSLQESYITPDDETFSLSELHVEYFDYNFFDVGVAVKVKGAVKPKNRNR